MVPVKTIEISEKDGDYQIVNKLLQAGTFITYSIWSLESPNRSQSSEQREQEC